MDGQYPSVGREGAGLPPVSPFTLSIKSGTVESIKTLVKLLYKMAHLKSYKQHIRADRTFLMTRVPDSALLMSYDFHLDSQGELKLIEVNTHSSGYLSSELADQVQGVEQAGGGGRALLSLKKSFEEEWQGFSGKSAPPPEVLVADHRIKDQKMYAEFLMYRDLLNRFGWPCQLCEIRDLSFNAQGELVDSCGQKVFLLYNRSIDFYFERLPYLRRAFLEGTCCISPHPREYLLLADKQRLCEWSRPDFLDKLVELSSAEKQTILNAVPFTARVDSVSAEELWQKRKALFFKPLRGYGGKSVYRGKSISHRVFERVMSEPGVFQQAVPAPIFVDPAGGRWKYDIRAYVYRDEVQKLSGRVYRGQVTQFREPLSGFASVIVK